MPEHQKQPARFYAREKDKIECLLCPRACRLGEGEAGICGVRSVIEGELYTGNYGQCAAIHWDPVEKKPLYHFYPGLPILSLGTYGCNLLCSFCQNWSLARGRADHGIEGRPVTPELVLDMLRREGGPEKVIGVAYTYNEPTIWYEFVYDTARLLHGNGYRNVLVTNGYINPEPLQALLPYIDAMNIDVKAFSDSFYEKHCRGMRLPVLETVRAAAASCHVEITCLLIPTLNDDPGEIEQLAEWLAGINPGLPLHFSRYFPHYRLSLPPTPVETMRRAREIAKKKLHHVYLGNVNLPGAADTYCPRCGRLLIERTGYSLRHAGLENGCCRDCRGEVDFIHGIAR